MANGSVQIDFHPALRYVSLVTQLVGSVCAIAGAALTLRLNYNSSAVVIDTSDIARSKTDG